MRLWEVASGRPRGQPLTGHIDPVESVAFSPDGKLLASASWDRTVRLWEVASGQPRGQPLTGHTHRVLSVAFSPDGKLLASASDDETVRLWEVASGRCAAKLALEGGVMDKAIWFGRNGRVLAVAIVEPGTFVVRPSVYKVLRP